MSVVYAPMTITITPFEVERKRTASFSVPHHAKARRTSSLQRTPAFLELPRMLSDIPSMELYGRSGAPRPSVSEAHPRSLRRRPSISTHTSDLNAFVASTAPLPSLHHPLPSRAFTPAPVASSSRLACSSQPAAPKPRSTKRGPRRFLPPRERYPSARAEPDLYRQALVARMQASPEGAKILLMGAHAAVSMLTATRELEALVAGADDMDCDSEDDTEDVEPRLSDSWLVVPQEDWEIVDDSSAVV